jgi:hypothetical protein
MTGLGHPTGPKILEDESFVWQHVWPRLVRGGDGVPRRAGFGLTVHRASTGRRHAVAEYDFDESRRVVAKLYTDPDEGHAAYRILHALWQGGFGASSAYRVPEPIAYLSEHGVLLMGRAQGEPLGGLETLDGAAFRAGLSQAARWLGALHVSPVRLGPEEDRLRDAFRMSRRLTEAARCRPDLGDVFRRSVEELATRCPPIGEPRTLVQTHRRYDASRVFLAADHVTVIGLDRVAVADPMKDVAEFIHRLRWDGALAGLDHNVIEGWTSAFLAEYARCSATDTASLSYQWSYSILWSLLGLACSRRTGEREWEERSHLLLEEFEYVPRLAAA